MDRHVKWLRRRIIASIATQTAETFAVVAVAAFALMQWRTSEGPLSVLFGSVVIGQLVAVARVGHALRNNPLNYVFMRNYVDTPFRYRVARFNVEEEAHEVALELPGFAPVATIRDEQADPSPVFDIYHDPSRLVAASISRASGAVSLISSLADGRVMVTDVRALPPHERLVMNLAETGDVPGLISAHRHAIATRTDVVELASSAHQVVLESLAIEYDAYVALGPALSPFLDLEASGRSFVRLVARIKPAELTGLPARLGPDGALSQRGTASFEPLAVTDLADVVENFDMVDPEPQPQPQAAALVAPVPASPAAPAPATPVVSPEIASVPIAEPQVAKVAVVAAEPAAVPTAMAPTPMAPAAPEPMALTPTAPAAPEPVVAAEVVAPTPLAPTPVAPTPVASTPVAPTPVASTPVAPTPVASTPVAPTPVASTPVAEPVVAFVEPPEDAPFSAALVPAVSAATAATVAPAASVPAPATPPAPAATPVAVETLPTEQADPTPRTYGIPFVPDEGDSGPAPVTPVAPAESVIRAIDDTPVPGPAEPATAEVPIVYVAENQARFPQADSAPGLAQSPIEPASFSGVPVPDVIAAPVAESLEDLPAPPPAPVAVAESQAHLPAAPAQPAPAPVAESLENLPAPPPAPVPVAQPEPVVAQAPAPAQPVPVAKPEPVVVMPAPAPTFVAAAPIAPQFPVPPAPAPTAPQAPVAPTPVAPTPVAPTPVAPTPVAQARPPMPQPPVSTAQIADSAMRPPLPNTVERFEQVAASMPPATESAPNGRVVVGVTTNQPATLAESLGETDVYSPEMSNEPFPSLAGAMAYDEETIANRPRLSAALKANQPAQAAATAGRTKSRRKFR